MRRSEQCNADSMGVAASAVVGVVRVGMGEVRGVVVKLLEEWKSHSSWDEDGRHLHR